MSKDSFKISNKKLQSGKLQELHFEGDLSIFNAEKIYKKLKRFTFSADDIIIILENIDTMDLTTVQTILSLKNTFESESKSVTINSNIPQEKQKLINCTGLGEFILK